MKPFFPFILTLLISSSVVFCQAADEIEKQELINRLEQEKQNAVVSEQKHIVAWVVSVGLLFGFGVLYKRYKDIQRHEKILEEQKNLVEEKNRALETANAQITQKNKDVTDSISYAKRIQNAMLPTESHAKTVLPEHFILFMPRDIVSGDFYWIEEWKHQVFIAAVDCTGHGVPGAFMSILGSDLLHEIVKDYGINKPAAILNALNKGLAKTLHQNTSSAEIKDGMDIAFCAIDKKNNLLEYAGAFNPLWLIRDNCLQEFNADKQPIGAFVNEKQTFFTNHEIQLQKGDAVYIFSDGYTDQFGGENGKKFRHKQFQELLLSIQENSMAEQKNILEKAIENWKGNLEQVDDILVIGLKF
ncbi:MAG: SpoIIE family protein phosphatase [Bacteroidetes bacterium]|nr:SpoIIE family protein phosphatase [Bacteroidota bacterium]